MSSAATLMVPGRDCPLCPRLADFRALNRRRAPDSFNAPVPSFGGIDCRVLIVGLAPGLKGANRTGRPFTGDHAGHLLYGTLKKFGFACGSYAEHPGDGLTLVDCRIANAVRCVPPQNKPSPAEIDTCRQFLEGELAALPNLRAVVALGATAHATLLTALRLRKASYPFAHGAIHKLPNGLVLADSYHCSRQNTNTGKLTSEMFESVFAEVRRRLG
jgi:uracil-DNA glycosylase family 4